MRLNTLSMVFVCALLAGCAELQENLPPPTGGETSVHPEGWTDPESGEFHGQTIRDDAWDMTQCQSCHGSDYEGGISGASCLDCHANSSGPENCATCHGSANSAPPRDLSEGESSALPGVGAHQVHLVGSGSVSDLVLACGQCHVVPVSVYAPGHLDSDLPAEVVISGGLAGPKPKDQFDVPEYDAGTTTCGNTFCHGAWSLSKASAPAFAQFAYTQDVMNGSNDSPTWTGGGDEIECGTCHGLPPDGHVSADLDDCGFCHSGTVSPEGMIVDVKLHMNGKVNTIFAPERPF